MRRQQQGEGALAGRESAEAVTTALSLTTIDALRGLAALAVLLAHAQWYLWLGNPGKSLGPHPSLLRIALYPFTFGRTAVLLFFVISGFCIHYKQACTLAPHAGGGADFTLLDYAWRRARRIMPPLLLALAFTYLADHLGAALNPSFYARHTPYTSFNALAIPVHSLPVLLGNVAFLQGLVVPSFGTDDPLWSLAYEGFFYALYPFLLIVRRRQGSRQLTTGILAVAVLAYLLYIPTHGSVLLVLMYLGIWQLGAFLADCYGAHTRLRHSWPVVGLGVALIALAIPFTYRAPQLYNLLVGCGFAALLGALLLSALPARVQAGIEGAATWLALLGTISYSLYLLHMPLITLLTAWWLSGHRLLPTSPLLLVSGMGLALALATLSYLAVERPALRIALPGRWRRAAPALPADGRVSP